MPGGVRVALGSEEDVSQVGGEEKKEEEEEQDTKTIWGFLGVFLGVFCLSHLVL